MTSPPSGSVHHVVGEVSPQTLDLCDDEKVGVVGFRRSKDAQ